MTDAREYDDRRRLTRLSAKHGDSALRDVRLTLDPASRITELEDLRSDVAAEASLSATYGYDDRYRLTSATDRVATTTWHYDAVSNILAVESGHDAHGLCESELTMAPGNRMKLLGRAIAGCALGMVVIGAAVHLGWDFFWFRRDRAEESRIMSVARRARVVFEASGECPAPADLWPHATPGAAPDMGYSVDDGDCTFEYWVGFDEYYQYSVREQRWKSWKELRGKR